MDLIKIINERFPRIFESYFKRLIDKHVKSDFAPNGYLYFRDGLEVDKWAKIYSDYFTEKESEYNARYFDQREYLPYDVFRWYAGYFSHNINEFLRSNEYPIDNEFITKRIEVMINEINKFQLKDSVVVMRRVANRHYDRKKIQVGMTISDKGFLSTSLDLSYRKDNESRYRPINNETILIIKIPFGQKGIYLEPISKRQEYELLLLNDRRLLIEKKRKILNTNILITKVIDD